MAELRRLLRSFRYASALLPSTLAQAGRMMAARLEDVQPVQRLGAREGAADRRRQPRVSIRAPAWVRAPGSRALVDAVVIDVSRGGMRLVLSGRPAGVGGARRLEVRAPALGIRRCWSTVAHRGGRPLVLGVRLPAGLAAVRGAGGVARLTGPAR